MSLLRKEGSQLLSADEGNLKLADGLANLLTDQGKLDEAEPLYRRVLASHEAKLGPDYLLTLTSINSLALKRLSFSGAHDNDQLQGMSPAVVALAQEVRGLLGLLCNRV